MPGRFAPRAGSVASALAALALVTLALAWVRRSRRAFVQIRAGRDGILHPTGTLERPGSPPMHVLDAQPNDSGPVITFAPDPPHDYRSPLSLAHSTMLRGTVAERLDAISLAHADLVPVVLVSSLFLALPLVAEASFGLLF